MGMPPRQCPGSISGHFHPTEAITDTLSSVLMYLDEVLLHASQGRRLDSDYVVTLSD
ncbi:MAG: L-rhamnose isomerase [Chloroflexi bacterium SZAS-1]|jgi:L-rhamnose isomerase|nr:L-rhamnose isomerase [Chloroflexi bacterium SZAS-1]